MENIPQSGDKPKEVTISPKIQEALVNIGMNPKEYEIVKTEIKNRLNPAGIWSPDFDRLMDEHIGRISWLGKKIRAMGGAREKKRSQSQRLHVESCRQSAIDAQKNANLWSPA